MRYRLFQLCLALSFATLAACSSEQARSEPDVPVVRDVFDREVQVSQGWSGSTEKAIRVPSQSGPDAWTIVLSAADSPEKGAILLQQVRGVGRLPDAFLMERNGRQVVAVGSYDSPTEQVAQIELERVRAIVIDGVKPFEHAFLAPPSGDQWRGRIPEYDLRNVRAQFGSKAEYTLQIAVFGREDDKPPTEDDRKQFQAAAEKAAVALRQEGEMAFYYHGPNRSMVTVGVFTEQDLEVDDGYTTESPRLTLTRQRHPLNLLNGRTIIEKVRMSTGAMVDRDQRSFLVQIPK